MPYRTPDPVVTPEHRELAGQLITELLEQWQGLGRTEHLARALAALEHRAAVHGYRAGSIGARRAMRAELGRSIERDATGWDL